jgi:agmatinase
MNDFDPNAVGIKNGNIFGFPVTKEEAEIVIIPVPWDLTASYRKGAATAPEMILSASTQLDFFHPSLFNAHDIKVHMTAISEDMVNINEKMRSASIEYLEFLENGGKLEENSKHSLFLDAANEAHDNISNALYQKTKELLSENKIPAALGGEHSIPLGLLKALGEYYDSFGILQIDAHADLRDSYEGFKQSHASIFHNVLKEVDSVKSLVQIGVRDLSQTEFDTIKNDTRVSTFFDWDLKGDQYRAKFWGEQVAEIINELPQLVYISFDIDGLNPSLCPNTGTPVPGGLKLEEVRYLFDRIITSGRKIIGFDLCEVGSADEWDANVGSRVLWELVVSTHLASKQK